MLDTVHLTCARLAYRDRRVYNANPQETTSGCPQLPVHELSGSDGSATGSLGDDTTPASRRVSTHGFAMDTDDGHRFNAHIADPSSKCSLRFMIAGD